ncbi:SPRY domain-containing protein [Thalassospira povalilytica]|uniref:DUF7483 domain-containing protein n=1 Tax=Thalassospira povalilytica TaxID=732237 RepID=UPI003AA861F2
MTILFDNPPPAIGCGDPGDPIDFAVLAYGGTYWSRSFPVAGNRTKWALAFEIKSVKGQDTPIFGVGVNQQFLLRADGGLQLRSNNGLAELVTARRFRDYAAHLSGLLVWDSTMPAPSDRVQLFVEDELITDFDTDQRSNIAQGSNSHINGAEIHYINNYVGGSGTGELLASRLIFLDGIKPTPADFGYRNSHGAWVLRKFAGEGLGEEAYGATGFHQNFANSVALVQDISGNGNHFTAVGLTVDNQVTDTPTNNCATFNPSDWTSGPLTAGNTRLSTDSSSYYTTCLSMWPPAIDRWYAEFIIHAGTHALIGVYDPSNHPTDAIGPGGLSYGQGLGYFQRDGVIWSQGTTVVASGGPTYGIGDRVGVGLDYIAGNVLFFKNGTLVYTIPILAGVRFTFAAGDGAKGPGTATPSDIEAILRADQMLYLPDGFRSLSSANLPCPKILNPDDYFTIRLAGDDRPLPWNPLIHKTLAVTKDRDSTTSWRVNDTVRGPGKAWACDVGGIEINEGATGVTWTANGPVYGSATEYQGNRITWFWRASPKAGFDIVLVDHVNGVASTIPHNVGGPVQYAWEVPLAGGDVLEFHHKLQAGDCLVLNSSSAVVTVAGGPVTSTANTVTIPADRPTGMRALYLHRGVPQYSHFGGYLGNDSVDGPIDPTDFSVRAFIGKGRGGGNHFMRDFDRSPQNPADSTLILNQSVAEEHNVEKIDLLSNGIKLRSSGSGANSSDLFYVTSMWAQTPGKFARAR